MRRITKILCLAFAAALMLGTAAWADELELTDGTVVKGTFVGGSRVNVHFRVDGKTKIYSRDDVSAIFLGDAQTVASTRSALSGSSKTATTSTGRNAASTTSTTTSSQTATTTGSGTVAAGSRIMVRMIDALDSEKNSPGDTFLASLEEDLVVNNVIVAGKGADVTGRLTEVKEAGKLTGKSELKLELTGITIDGRNYNLTTGEYELAGKSRGKDTAVKVGGGAAVGAVIGAIAGGGKGAAIGAGIGAGAGTAIQVFTKGEQVKVPSETLLEFTLEQDLVVRRASNRNRR